MGFERIQFADVREGDTLAVMPYLWPMMGGFRPPESTHVVVHVETFPDDIVVTRGEDGSEETHYVSPTQGAWRVVA